MNVEELETIGVSDAIDYIRKTKDNLSITLIKKIHKIVFDKSKVFAGKIRDVDVVIKANDCSVIHRGIPPKDIRKELKNMIRWY